jgi:glycosyltransferase involved in cell wall biosynthesis
MTQLTYALVTPARDERANLERLATCVCSQTVLPLAWNVVDNGSTDGTAHVALALAEQHSWVRVLQSAPTDKAEPGLPIVRAFVAGLAVLETQPDVVVKLDADVSFAPDHFERLLRAFGRDSRLGIAGGVCFELEDGEWRPTHVTGAHVRGAVRAYRRACLESISPLEEGLGWDTIDEVKAAVLGWRTEVVGELRFDHHRSLGARDGLFWSRAHRQGRAARYMGYRFSYLVARALFRARKDPAALAMIWGYCASALQREPVLADERVRAEVRRTQRLSDLPLRAREALGRRVIPTR